MPPVPRTGGTQFVGAPTIGELDDSCWPMADSAFSDRRVDQQLNLKVDMG